MTIRCPICKASELEQMHDWLFECPKCHEHFEFSSKYNIFIHPKILDIAYNYPPSSVLSNLFPSNFIIDDQLLSPAALTKCASIEGFLRSLVIHDNIDLIAELWSLHGYDAWRVKYMLPDWHKSQTLYYHYKPVQRESADYVKIITYAYDRLFESSNLFRLALKMHKDTILIHSMGLNDPKKTLLTSNEYISQLNRLRQML